MARVFVPAAATNSPVSPTPDDAGAPAGAELRPLRAAGQWHSFLRDRSAVAGLAIVSVLIVLAVAGPSLAPKSPLKIHTNRLLLGPGHGAWFGTDNLGRDLFSRVVAGARVSISLALVIGALMMSIGVFVGSVAGYFGRAVDTVAMRVADVVLAFPPLILALAIAGTLGAGYRSVIIALVATNWPYYARLVRSGVLAEREREYVDSARCAGARPRRILFRHILPNAAAPVLVLLSFDLGTLILYIASLGYLGVGIPPPTPEWGTMVADGRNFVFTAPQMIVFPGLAVALSVIGFNLLGDGLRNALDPRQDLRAARRRRFSWRRAAGLCAQTRARRELARTIGNEAAAVPKVALDVRSLTVRIRSRGEDLEPVSGVSLSVGAGETVGLVGESGSGKTMTAMAVTGLLPPGAAVAGGTVVLAGEDVTGWPEDRLRRVRGRRVGVIFQDPLASLNPTMTVGRQIADPVRFHLGQSRAQARDRAIELLGLVGMPDPRRRYDDYPHQLSGGQRQRVMIAMALACEPDLLIADEPTTALDVSIQDQILALLGELQSRLGMGLLLITHDMGVIARMADRVLVMYAGRIVESATAPALFGRTRHPYTKALLESIPGLEDDRSSELYSIPGRPPELAGRRVGCPFAPRCRSATERCRAEDPVLAPAEPGHDFACFHPVPVAVPVPVSVTPRPARPVAAPAGGQLGEPVLVVEGLVKEFAARGRGGAGAGRVHAVSDVSFQVARGETFGLVGESGCGKTTVGRLITALEVPDAGAVAVDGVDLAALPGSGLRRARRRFQLVFQDAQSSLDPRWRIEATLQEPMLIHRIGTPAERNARVEDLLDEVGLEHRALERFPHEFSGGQRQRIGFARALTVGPLLVVADEPVSSLDVSIRSQILNLMLRLQRQHRLTYVLISHDLSVVRYLADRVGVMYLGRLVEIGPTADIYRHPLHPYTAGLLAAVPVPDPERERGRRHTPMRGEPASAIDPPSGCRFRTRCPRAQEVCAEVTPPLRSLDGGAQQVACHFPLSEPDGLSA